MSAIDAYDRNDAPPDVLKRVRGYFRGYDGCKRSIPLWYFKESLGECDYILEASIQNVSRTRQETKRGGAKRCQGFLLAKAVRSTGKATMLYIDLVCSANRKGRALVEAAEALAKELRLSHVQLRAIKPAVPFYRRIGYIGTKNACTSKDNKRPPGNMIDGYYMSKCVCK